MERYYDGDQEALFKAAHVINPYVKPKKEPKVKKVPLTFLLTTFPYFLLCTFLDFSLLNDGRL